ncbi:MAG: ATP-binding protein [Bacteroidia bacterium]|nr:ATP-binding protein [Bacteroidia bacterium]
MNHPFIAQTLLEQAIHNAVTGVVISDCSLPDMPLIYFNPAFEKLTGYPKEEILGFNCRFLQGPETDQSQIDKLRSSVQAGQTCTITLLNYKKNGEKFWNELTISPVKNEEGDLTHFIGIQVDVTSKVEALQQLISSKEAAEESSRIKTEFLNSISHELRTPLTVMLGNLPLLTNEEALPEPEEIVEISKDIEESGHYLLELINELLDISRIEENRLSLFPTPIDIIDVAEELIQSMASMARQKKIALTQDIQNFNLVTDPKRLKQILYNIIGNAIKFTDSGEVRIEIFPLANQGIIRVTDTGPGIKPSFLPYVFDVFRQENTSATRLKSGSGLGLAITKRLVELQGGTILAESTFGSGSTFTITFPI